MTWQAWGTLAVLGATIYVLARDLLPPPATILGAAILLLVAGIITPAQALAGFSNPAPVTVAAMYILARAVEKTGGLQPILEATLGRGGQGRWSLVRLLAPAAGASAFLNNTPIVAMLITPVSDWATRRGISPSRLLMPLSFAVILGGMVTLIGTSTNLVVSGLLQARGQAPLGMFELTPVGLPAAVLGVALLALLAPVLLPERKAAQADLQERGAEFVVSMRVVPAGPLDGVAVEEGRLRNLQGVYLVEVERGGERIAPVAPDTLLKGNDVLTFVGRAGLVVDLQGMRGLVSVEERQLAHFDTARHTFFEVVIGAASPLTGRTLKEIGFRSRYQAAVVAVHRSGHRVEGKLGELPLALGDTLLVLTDPGFRERWRDRGDFLLIYRLGGSAPAASRKAWLVGLITLAIVVGAGAGLIPILQASLLGAVALLASGVLTPGEAKDAVSLDVLVVIASAFALAAAIENSGLASALAHGLVHLFAPWGRTGALLGVVLATVLLNDLITNNATAALMFPLGVAVAQETGTDLRPFAIAITIAASCSFLTPIGYQTNTMVYGPGGYRFSDYIRLGAPLTLLIVTTIVVMVPFLWGW